MRTALPALAQGASLRTTAKVWNFFAERGGEIDLMVLLLHNAVRRFETVGPLPDFRPLLL
jgi:hypothetical protein